MGDLKINETFEDRVYITDSNGAAKTGLAPSCTIIDESGGRSLGTTEEMSNGWYHITDFTPDASGTWCLEWAVAGAYVVLHPFKMFKVGGGVLDDLNTLLGTPTGADISTDLAALNTALTFQHQADASLTQASPGNGTYYTVLDTSLNVRIKEVAAHVHWTLQPDDLFVKITVDGQVLSFKFWNPVNTQNYMPYLTGVAGGGGYRDLLATSSLYSAANDFLLEGRSVKVEVAVTSGTVQSLDCVIVWAKR